MKILGKNNVEAVLIESTDIKKYYYKTWFNVVCSNDDGEIKIKRWNTIRLFARNGENKDYCIAEVVETKNSWEEMEKKLTSCEFSKKEVEGFKRLFVAFKTINKERKGA